MVYGMMIACIMVLLSKHDVRADSLNFGDTLKQGLAPGEWSGSIFEGSSRAVGRHYDYLMERSHAMYNGSRWDIIYNTSGFVAWKATKSGMHTSTGLAKPYSEPTNWGSILETRLLSCLPNDLEWVTTRGESTAESCDAAVFRARFRGLPVLSKRLAGEITWNRDSGEVICFGAQLRRPTSIINEGDPISPQIAALRMQPHLRNPERTLDPKKLILGWSVETNEGRTRLIYFYEAPPPAGLDRLAVDAVTGQLVEPPPYR